MKRRYFIGIFVAAGLFGAGTLAVGQSKVSPQAIAPNRAKKAKPNQRCFGNFGAP
jgi:hypothetical protein